MNNNEDDMKEYMAYEDEFKKGNGLVFLMIVIIGITQAILFFLKIANVVHMSWFVACMPFIIEWGICIIFLIVWLVILEIKKYKNKYERR